MDKCRTLQANLPKNIRGVCPMTAAHLISRLPSKTLGMKNPLEFVEKLFPRIKLRNGLKPGVFGCISYVCAQTMQPDNLTAKGLNTQEGYKCYLPTPGKLLVLKYFGFLRVLIICLICLVLRLGKQMNKQGYKCQLLCHNLA